MVQVFAQRSLVLSLADETLFAIAQPRAELARRTGKDIDEYGTTTLEPAHCRLLATLIRARQPSELRLPLGISELLTQLDAAANGGYTLLFEGD